jgi:hypothetical protein
MRIILLVLWSSPEGKRGGSQGLEQLQPALTAPIPGYLLKSLRDNGDNCQSHKIR